MGSRIMGSGSFSVIPISFPVSLRTDTSYRAGAVNPSRGSEEENKSLPVGKRKVHEGGTWTPKRKIRTFPRERTRGGSRHEDRKREDSSGKEKNLKKDAPHRLK